MAVNGSFTIRSNNVVLLDQSSRRFEGDLVFEGIVENRVVDLHIDEGFRPRLQADRCSQSCVTMNQIRSGNQGTRTIEA